MRPSVPVRAAVLSGAAAVALALVLSGCVPESESPEPSDSTSPPAVSGPVDGASGSASPRPSSSASAPNSSATPVRLGCEELVSNQTVYDFGPIYSSETPFTPTAGTPAARAKTDSGQACRWVNTTSGDTIELSVADYDATTIAALKAGAASGTPVNDWGADAGYFRVDGDVGIATAFVGGDWIVCRSVVFGTGSDASPFMSSAVAALK